MARRNWHGGAGDGNLATSGNYDTFPVSGDSLAFSGGHVSITAGLSALSGMTLSAVIINEGFKGTQIGTAGSPAKFRTPLFKVATNTAGLIAVRGETTFDEVKVEKLSGANLFIGEGTPDIDSIELGAGPGHVEVGSNVDVAALRTAGIHAKLGPIASSPPDMVANIGRGSIVESQRKVAQAVVNGTLKVTEAGSIAHTTSALCFCIVADQGRLNFSATGTFRRVERLPGSTLDFDGAKQDVTLMQDIPYAGSTMKLPQGVKVTVSDSVPVGYSPIPTSI